MDGGENGMPYMSDGITFVIALLNGLNLPSNPTFCEPAIIISTNSRVVCVEIKKSTLILFIHDPKLQFTSLFNHISMHDIILSRLAAIIMICCRLWTVIRNQI